MPQVREEAGELCETLENGEGKQRAASEAADLLYHAMVLLNAQVRAPCLVSVYARGQKLEALGETSNSAHTTFVLW